MVFFRAQCQGLLKSLECNGICWCKREASASETRNALFLMLFSSNLDDEVFLANEAQRQEYILNQDGVIYWGTENAVLAQPWDFSQVSKRSSTSALSYTHQQRKDAYLLCVCHSFPYCGFNERTCTLHPLSLSKTVQENMDLCMNSHKPVYVILATFSGCPL